MQENKVYANRFLEKRASTKKKIYVDVTVTFSKEGIVRPISILWQDGHVYEIQKITDICRENHRKDGNSGLRYTCYVDGKISHLYYEDNNMWFVEGKDL